MSDGNTDGAALEVDEEHDNVARIEGADCCGACFVQCGEPHAFTLALDVDGLTRAMCPVCMRLRALENSDPFLEQRRRWREEGGR